MSAKDIKISQKMKNKGQLSKEKKIKNHGKIESFTNKNWLIFLVSNKFFG